MTARQVYEAMLIEMNKVEAPSMLLEDFNYIINKAIYQFINKTYNMYDANQQMSDNIRVLKSTVVLTPNTDNDYPNIQVTDPKTGETIEMADPILGDTVEFTLPNNYLHILNCVCNFKVAKNFKCYNAGTNVQFGAYRLTSDLWSQIINNFYMRPSYRRPYYFIHNVGVDSPEVEKNPTEELSNSIVLGAPVEKEATVRYGNSSPVRLEIRYGKDKSLFNLTHIYVDYIKTPQHIRLTQEQLDLTEDTSQILEFPDYVCQEIINELVKLMMENASDPRLQTNLPINQTIASPVPQQSNSK